MHTDSSKLSFALGWAGGWLMAPMFGLVSFVRHARTFHPHGPVFHGRIKPHPNLPDAQRALAERLEGHALVRFSGALWKSESRVPDVLGCALRLRRDQTNDARAARDDQDLLFATIRRPWSMPFSPLTTNVRDYLLNDYFAVSPFTSADTRGAFYLRVHPLAWERVRAGTRRARLDRANHSGSVVLDLERSAKPFGPWEPLAQLCIERAADIDEAALRFDAFRTGRGLRPYGFIHALRIGVYKLSQRARPRGSVHSDREVSVRADAHP